MTMPARSSPAITSSSSPTMLSAAIDHATTDTMRLMKALRIRLAAIAITTQAVARLAATPIR